MFLNWKCNVEIQVIGKPQGDKPMEKKLSQKQQDESVGKGIGCQVWQPELY